VAFNRAGMESSKGNEGHKVDPADVARDGLEALMAGKDHVVAGSTRNRPADHPRKADQPGGSR
jgi:hypothetical protein